jgi:hypothetical protein
MAKNNKKNTTSIEWPADSHFTIDDVQTKYPDVVNITLRFRVKKAIENKEIIVIGKIKPAIGRPKIVFARANPTKELLEAAKAAGVISEETKAAIAVAEMKSEMKSEKKVKAVVPSVPNKETVQTTS